MRRHVVIVGAGVTGLSAAWYLRRAAEERGLDLDCTLLEREARVGGKVWTRRVDHARGTFLVEAGADSFLAQMKPWALELAVEIGLAGRLIGTNDGARRVLVLRRGRLHPLPEGILLIVPTRLLPFLRSGLLSPWGKLRTACDLVLPRRRDPGDETLAAFVTRRLGAEVLDRIAEPLLSGIYNADAGRQSVLATLPRLRQMEAEHRSLILAALRSRRTRKAGSSAASRAPIDRAGGRPLAGVLQGAEGSARQGAAEAAARVGGSIFASFPGGTGELTERLRASAGADLRRCTEAVELRRTADGTFEVHVAPRRGVDRPDEEALPTPCAGGKRGTSSCETPGISPGETTPADAGAPLVTGAGGTLAADAVLLCTPAAETARLLGPVAPGPAGLAASIRSVSSGSVSLGYDGLVVRPEALGFGLVIPSSERRPINAVTYSSVKLPGRAPADTSLLRVFFGGSRSPQTMALDDEEVFAVVRRQLKELLAVDGEPLFCQIDRWPDAQPQYDVGHLDLVRRIEEGLPAGLWVAGSPFRGVGIPDCVRQGRDAARRIVDLLT